MNLADYLKSHRGKDLAAAIGVTPVLISQWMHGVRQVPAARCPSIERATQGEVRCEELRPDVDWGVLRNSPVLKSEIRCNPDASVHRVENDGEEATDSVGKVEIEQEQAA